MSGYSESNSKFLTEVAGAVSLVALFAVLVVTSCHGTPAMADIPDDPVLKMSKAVSKEATEMTEVSDISAPEPQQETGEVQEAQPQEEQAVDQAPEVYYEETYYEPYQETYYEPVYYSYSSGGYSNDFQSAGVVYGDDGTRYTWYSQRVLSGGGLDIPGRHVNDSGYVCDGEGNIAVASSDHAYGTKLDTPFGSAVVYDSGCDSGTVDIYTDF